MNIEYIIAALLVVVTGLLVMCLIKLQRKQPSDAERYLQADILNLRSEVSSLSTNLSKTFDDKLNRTQDSMQEQLRQSVAIVNDVSRRLTKLDETNKRVVDVADELKTLQNVLQNPKQRGVFGEFYLNSLLENVLPPNQWQAQYKFKNGEIVDAVIFLDKRRILPVDSKFSLENYNRYIEATDKDQREQLLRRVKQDIKGRIDETAKYIRPDEGTMDFAFMFIPSESMYYDLLKDRVGDGASSRDLIEYAFRDRHVIIVSPTSFMAYLETVMQGLRSLQIEEQAKEIQKRVAQLGMHIERYNEYMSKLGVSLGTTVNHYNNAYKEFAKVDKDIVKIADKADDPVEPLAVDRPSNQ